MGNLILVDSNNNALGEASKELCHDGRGRLHRAFSIFVFNQKMELLLQKRAESKRLWPGYWSNSCCSHPVSGESNFFASTKRLTEELGITCGNIVELYNFEYRASYQNKGSENELCFVMICRYDYTLTVNHNEVSETRWISLTDLELEIESNPIRFTPWLKLELKKLISSYPQQIKRICS